MVGVEHTVALLGFLAFLVLYFITLLNHSFENIDSIGFNAAVSCQQEFPL